MTDQHADTERVEGGITSGGLVAPQILLASQRYAQELADKLAKANRDVQKWRRSAFELQRRIDELEEALAQASECCARPSGVCFDPSLASGQR